MNRPPVILFGVCGGIAAYKAAEVVSALAKSGAAVHVAMTAAAQRFVTAVTFASLTRRRVLAEMFPSPFDHDGEALFPHLYPSSGADLFVVIPATADMMAKLAGGMADDVVSASALALPSACRRVFCPAMNSGMWRSAATQANARRLEEAGWIRVGPATGDLACGRAGEGRLSEPEEIVPVLRRLLDQGASMAGKTVLILSGPTREHLDAVRFVSNASSGRMGRCLAEEAAGRGAAVEFVTGPVDEARIPGGPAVRVHRVESAAEMLDAARAPAARADLLVFAAAVADYRPAAKGDGKAPKAGAPFDLRLEPTPDLAATLAPSRKAGAVAVGFALEGTGGERRAAVKLESKHLDGIVMNGPDSMGAEAASFRFLARDAQGAWADWGRLTKPQCAARIMDEAVRRMNPET